MSASVEALAVLLKEAEEHHKQYQATYPCNEISWPEFYARYISTQLWRVSAHQERTTRAVMAMSEDEVAHEASKLRVRDSIDQFIAGGDFDPGSTSAQVGEDGQVQQDTFGADAHTRPDWGYAE